MKNVLILGCGRSGTSIFGELFESLPGFSYLSEPDLDAICSLRVGIGFGEGHHPHPPDWRAWGTRTLVEQCAHHWATINGPGFDQVRDQATVQSFESMIVAPRETARLVAERCEVPMTKGIVARFRARVRGSLRPRP